MHRLLTWLRARAIAGRPLPSLDGIADELDLLQKQQVSELLALGVQKGLIVVEYQRNGIASVAATDGSWRAVRGEERLPDRRCLACRRPFQPRHRFNFLCCEGQERRTPGAAALALLALLSAPAAAQQRATAIDGDTLRVEGRSVRMIGLDAPELHGACEAERWLARLAQMRLAQLVAEGVWIELRGRDRYGRDLAIIRDAAGRDLAQLLISEGFARPFDGRGRREGWC
jgi:hypothetical protein